MIFYSLIIIALAVGFGSSYLIYDEVTISALYISVATLALILIILFLFGILIPIIFKNNWKSLIARKILIFLISIIATFYGIILKTKYETKLPKNTNFTVVSNHQSFLDIVVALKVFKGYYLSGIAKEELGKAPFLKQWFKQTRYLTIDRNDTRKSALTIMQAAKQVKEGQPMIIYPEGTRSKDPNGAFGEFKAGAFNLATKSESDIYMLCVHNLYSRKFVLLPRKTYVTVLKPLKYEEYKDMNTTEISELCKSRIEECFRGGY